MSLFHETWRKEAYYPRHSMQLRDLPENHLKRVKEVPFEFHDYKYGCHKQTNTKFPCLPYERTLVQCLNNYGAQGTFEVPECQQLAHYFNECVTIHKYFGTLKKWNPEHFAESEYSRQRHSLSDLGL